MNDKEEYEEHLNNGAMASEATTIGATEHRPLG